MPNTLQLSYQQEFLASYAMPSSNSPRITNERVADIYGQVYASDNQVGSSLAVVGEDGVLISSRTFASMYDDFALTVNDRNIAIPSSGVRPATVLRASHMLVGKGRFLLVALSAVKNVGPQFDFETQYKKFYLVYECRDGLAPLFRNAVFSKNQFGTTSNNAFLCGAGTDDDPIAIMGRRNDLIDTRVDTATYVIPSINEIIASDLDEWWTETSYANEQYEVPQIIYNFSDQDGVSLQNYFGRTSNDINTPQGVRIFKLDNENTTKVFWYVSKESLDRHRAAGSGINPWVENEVAPNHLTTGALIGVDFGVMTAATMRPTGSSAIRGIAPSPATDDTALLLPVMADDGKQIINSGVNGNTLYVNPKVLHIANKQYVVFVLVSYDQTDRESEQPGETYVQKIRVKFYKYLPLAGTFDFDTETEGILFTNTEFGNSLNSPWDIHNIGAYIGQNGKFIVAGSNDIQAVSNEPNTLWWAAFGVLTVQSRVRRKTQII